ncbi:hypothetical protein O6H91_Y322700 [Diphasiastrum complanatum]|nr:hypothetical protein O6H91_Y322700 [Diphasiastrum complanatum]
MPSDYEEDDECDYAFDDSAMDDEFSPPSRLPQSSYIILSENDIRQRQEKAIASVVTVLSTSKTDASILLRHFKWSVSKVNDEWFADEERVRKIVGLISFPNGEFRGLPKELTCGICFERHGTENMKAAICSHYFCNNCWLGQFASSLFLCLMNKALCKYNRMLYV